MSPEIEKRKQLPAIRGYFTRYHGLLGVLSVDTCHLLWMLARLRGPPTRVFRVVGTRNTYERQRALADGSFPPTPPPPGTV